MTQNIHELKGDLLTETHRLSEAQLHNSGGRRESMDFAISEGHFVFHVWTGLRGQETIALTTVGFDPEKDILLRIHSECITGDNFGAFSCDCGEQKTLSLKNIHAHGNGLFIYHRQEGRNMGLVNKVRAYNLMQMGLDTHQANIQLTGHPDQRDYESVFMVLNDLKVRQNTSITLLTNNPSKLLELQRAGFPVYQAPLSIKPNEHNLDYQNTKNVKFAHGNRSRVYKSATVTLRDFKLHASRFAELTATEDYKERLIGIWIQNDQITDETVDLLNAYLAPKASIALHMDWENSVIHQGKIKTLIRKLHNPITVQFRVQGDLLGHLDITSLKSIEVSRHIFQLKNSQFGALNNSDFVRFFSQNENAILIDDSFGKGVEIDVDGAKTQINKLLERGISNIGVAGGFTPYNTGPLNELEDYFKLPLSIDAESGLRSNGNADIKKISQYFSNVT